MPVIQVLPPDVASKIAAGEVVERPASVVKELVDNSLDAGADRIVVEIQDGGSKLIRVTDNGSGMSREDARLAIERHSTSKIRLAEDLDAIATFGFRGEALASIAAVTRFELVTRRAEDLEGTRLSMEGTVAPEVEPIGCPAGTTVIAADIYFNTPARRKFLKTTATELSNVADMFNRAALPHHSVHFTLRHNNKDIHDYPKVHTREERLVAFLGRKGWDHLRRLPDTGGGSASSAAVAAVEGFASLPTESRNRPDQVFFFVNDRYVQNRMLLGAVMQAYRRLLHPGRYPTVLLFLYVDPALIDINVHPKKQEVKFADEQRVWRVVHGAVREALSQMEREGTAPLAPRPMTPPAPGEVSAGTTPAAPPGQAEQIRRAVDRFFERQAAEERAEDTPAPTSPPAARPAEAKPVTGQTPVVAETAGATSTPQLFEKEGKPVPRAQLLDTYIVCEQGERMVLIDQHAAAERIRYEQLKRQAKAGAVGQQALLFPVTVEVPPGEVSLLEENLPLFGKLGFDLEFFGQNTFSVSAVPAVSNIDDCESVVRDLLRDLTGAGEGSTLDEIEERLLVRLACHHSIRGGDRLSPEAVQDLVEQLFQAEHPYTCPHGRPTLVALGKSELERMFKRSGF